MLLAYNDLITNKEANDTASEFVREKTYYPQLCLIQVATSRQVATSSVALFRSALSASARPSSSRTDATAAGA